MYQGMGSVTHPFYRGGHVSGRARTCQGPAGTIGSPSTTPAVILEPGVWCAQGPAQRRLMHRL